jgi:hypothetical protein
MFKLTHMRKNYRKIVVDDVPYIYRITSRFCNIRDGEERRTLLDIKFPYRDDKSWFSFLPSDVERAIRKDILMQPVPTPTIKPVEILTGMVDGKSFALIRNSSEFYPEHEKYPFMLKVFDPGFADEIIAAQFFTGGYVRLPDEHYSDEKCIQRIVFRKKAALSAFILGATNLQNY